MGLRPPNPRGFREVAWIIPKISGGTPGCRHPGRRNHDISVMMPPHSWRVARGRASSCFRRRPQCGAQRGRDPLRGSRWSPSTFCRPSALECTSCIRQFTTLAACQAVPRNSFPEAAPQRFGRVQHGIASGRVAEPAWSGNGVKRPVAETLVNHSKHPLDADRTQLPAKAPWIVAAPQAKSPWRSPLAAASTRAACPLQRRASGSAPSRAASGAVSQRHAA